MLIQQSTCWYYSCWLVVDDEGSEEVGRRPTKQNKEVGSENMEVRRQGGVYKRGGVNNICLCGE